MTVLRAVPIGIGHYLPKNIIENSYFETFLDTSDDWIKARSGIERRHFAEDNELTSDLGFAAAKNALKHASLNANDIDAIIVATSTPDLTFPSTAIDWSSAFYGFDLPDAATSILDFSTITAKISSLAYTSNN